LQLMSLDAVCKKDYKHPFRFKYAATKKAGKHSLIGTPS